MEDLYVVPLHHLESVIDGCVEILNEEWKRSVGARYKTPPFFYSNIVSYMFNFCA